MSSAAARASMQATARHMVVVFALLAASAVVYAPLLSLAAAPYSPYSDIAAFHVGLKSLLSGALTTGLPLWRTDQLLGGPALTQPQTLFLHPLQAAFLWLAPERAFGITFWLELSFGAVGAYLLGLALGCSRAASALTALAQLVSVKLMLACYAGWSSPMAVLVTLPWVAAAFTHFARAPRFGSFVLLAASISLALAGGAPQTLYYLLLVLGGYAWFSQATAPARASRGLAGTAGLLLAVMLACGCMAYLWLPIALDLPRLARAQQSYEFFLSGHALAPSDLLTLLHPEALGTPLRGTYPRTELWEECAYVGLVPLAGALFCLARARSLQPQWRYLLTAFIASLALSLDTPVLRALHDLLPGYALFRLPARMLFVSALLACALLACAVDELRTRLPARLHAQQRVGYALLVLLMAAEGGYYARAYVTTIPAAQLLPDAAHPLRGLGAERHERVAIVSRGTFNYGWAAPLGIELVNGYDPYTFTDMRRYLQLVEHGRPTPPRTSNWTDLREPKRLDLLRNLAVGYVVSQTGIDHPALGPARRVDGVRNFTLYKGMRETTLQIQKLRDSLPRARFAEHIIGLPSSNAVESALVASTVSEQDYIAVTPRAGHTEPPDVDDRVQQRARTPERIEFTTHASRGRLLVLSEAFHPGWRAAVDGAPQAPLPVNLALLGVWVPAGAHAVSVWFEPPGFRAGVGVSVASVACLLALVVLAAVRGTRQRRTDFAREPL